MKVFGDHLEGAASKEWSEARQRYILGSEDLCLWCGNQAGCPYWESIKDIRVYGRVFIADCPFRAKEVKVRL